MPSSRARPSRSSIDENKNVFLVIQTNVSGRLLVWIVTHQGKVLMRGSKVIEWHGSEQMLALVDAVLRKKKKGLADVSGIVVVRGPGPFTAVRTGLVVANT